MRERERERERGGGWVGGGKERERESLREMTSLGPRLVTLPAGPGPSTLYGGIRPAPSPTQSVLFTPLQTKHIKHFSKRGALAVTAGGACRRDHDKDCIFALFCYVYKEIKPKQFGDIQSARDRDLKEKKNRNRVTRHLRCGSYC